MFQRTGIRYGTIWEYIIRGIDFCALFVCMYLSELLIDNIIFGGAIYLLGCIWVIYARLYNQKSIGLLPRSTQSKGMIVFILTALLTVALVFLFPYIQSKPTAVVLVLLIAAFLAQQIVTDTISQRYKRSLKRRNLLLLAVHLAFLGLYIGLFWANHKIVQYAIPKNIGTAYLAVIGISAMMFICQAMEPIHSSDAPPAPSQDIPDPDKIMDIRSYRIYNKMAYNTLLAINLSLTSFILYMRFLPYTGFGASIAMLIVWLAYIGIIAALFFLLIRRRYLNKYEKPAILILGLALWVIATFRLMRGWNDSTLSSLINAALMGMSFACMFSILIEQGYEMKSVIELGVGEIDQGIYVRNTNAMIDWSRIISYLLLLVMLTAATFLTDDRVHEIEMRHSMLYVLQFMILILPMLAILLAVAFSIVQPLDRNYVDKLRKYRALQLQGKKDPPLEDRLQKILVSNYPRQLAVKIIKPIARPFIPCKVLDAQHVDLSNGPVVFVCNHLEIYGPIIAVLHSPFYFRPWILSQMLDADAVNETIRSGVDKVFHFLSDSMRDRVRRLASPILLWILRSTDPIPVHRGTVREVIQTIQLSVDAMEYDDNILLFPETDYPPEGVGTFFTGFVQVAKSFYQKTGQCTTFYPMYINKKKRQMTYGEGIRYNPDNGAGDEKERIVNHLRQKMNAMAER